MLRIRDETGNESNKQEAGLVHQEFLSFIVCIFFFSPLSASKDKEESIPKISKCQWTEERLQVAQNCGTVLPDRFFFGRE